MLPTVLCNFGAPPGSEVLVKLAPASSGDGVCTLEADSATATALADGTWKALLKTQNLEWGGSEWKMTGLCGCMSSCGIGIGGGAGTGAWAGGVLFKTWSRVSFRKHIA